MRKFKNTYINDIEEPKRKKDDEEEMDDLEFDEMNDVWDELDDLDF